MDTQERLKKANDLARQIESIKNCLISTANSNPQEHLFQLDAAGNYMRLVSSTVGPDYKMLREIITDLIHTTQQDAIDNLQRELDELINTIPEE